MILDTLANSGCYIRLHPAFPAAFAWLETFDPATADGRHGIDGDRLFAIVQRYETGQREQKRWETHRVHGDIQYMVSGSESLGCAPRDPLAVSIPYDSGKDAVFYHPPEQSSTLLLPEGSFAVFLPQDAHQTGILVREPRPVLKVVVKFRLG